MQQVEKFIVKFQADTQNSSVDQQSDQGHARTIQKSSTTHD